MFDAPTIAAIAAMLAALISLGTITGFFIKRGRDEGAAEIKLKSAVEQAAKAEDLSLKLKADVVSAKDRADKAEALSAACLAELKLAQERMGTYREKMAERLGNIEAQLARNNEGLTAAENRLVKSLDQVRDQMENLANRINQMITGEVVPARRVVG